MRSFLLAMLGALHQASAKGFDVVYPLIERRAAETLVLSPEQFKEQIELTFSDDSPAKVLEPFIVSIYDTDGNLPGESIASVEYALEDFVIAELNAHYGGNNNVGLVAAAVIYQKPTSTTSIGGRNLQSLGSELKVQMNVTFDNEPSPDVADVESTMEAITSDFTYLVPNITSWGSDDTELANVHSAVLVETPTDRGGSGEPAEPNITPIEGPVPSSSDSMNFQFLIPVAVSFGVLVSLIALLFVRHKKGVGAVPPIRPIRGRERYGILAPEVEIYNADDNSDIFSFEATLVESPERSPRKDPLSPTESDIFSGIGSEPPPGTRSISSPRNGDTKSVFSFLSTFTRGDASTVMASNVTKTEKEKTKVIATRKFLGKSRGEGAIAVTSPNSSTPHSRVSSLFTFSEEDDDDTASGIGAGKTEKVALVDSRTAAMLRTSIDSVPSDEGDAVNESILEKPFDEVTPRAKMNKRKSPMLGIISSNDSSTYGPKALSRDSPTTARSPFAWGNNSPSIADTLTSMFVFDSLVAAKSGLSTVAEATKSSDSRDDDKFCSVDCKENSLSPSKITKELEEVERKLMDGKPNLMMPSLGAAVAKSGPTSGSKVQTVDPYGDKSAPIGVRKQGSPPVFQASPHATKSIDPPAFASNVSTPTSSQSTEIHLLMSEASPRSNTSGNMASSAAKEPSLEQNSFNFSASRRHAKSTAADGTMTYQNGMMAPSDNELSMQDDQASFTGSEASDLAGRVKVKSGPESKRQQSTGRSKPQPMSKHAHIVDKESLPHLDASAVASSPPPVFVDTPIAMATSRSGISQLTGYTNLNDTLNDTTVVSEASTSKKVISDLVWLEKKIAGTQETIVASPETSIRGSVADEDASTGKESVFANLQGVDSLSFASGDGELSITSSLANDSTTDHASPSPVEAPTTPGSSRGYHTIVCRDCYAPPGKLKIVIHSTKDGPAVHTVKDGSSLEGHIYPGDLIISVDNVDTRSYTAEQVMKMMVARTKFERKITVLHFEADGP